MVWQAAALPFGRTQVQLGTVQNNLRFPGQYFDAETGLHYNWNRYYDPDTGRYLSPDPIGLDGGMNLYAYVGNDPVNFIDFEGLIWVTIEHDNHGIKNWSIIIARQIAFAQEGRVITHTDNAIGSTRDVIQEWQCDSAHPERNGEHPIGQKRKIKQTFQKKPGKLKPGLWSTSNYWWTPQVPARTYDDY